MSKPGFFFYTGDYLKDTRCLTADARGCYMDWLCVLHEHGGTITWPVSAYANFSGVSEEIARGVLLQIALTGVADVEFIDPQTGQTENGKRIAKTSKIEMAKLSNRRMMRDAQEAQKIKEVRAESGRRGASKRWQNTDGKNGTLLLPSPSLIPDSSYKNKSSSDVPPSAALLETLKAKEAEEVSAKIKAVTDKIYHFDPERYAKLIVWVNQAKNHFSAALVLNVLENFARIRAADPSIRDWRAYLSQVIEREEKKQNGLEAQRDAAKEKRREAEWARGVSGGRGLRAENDY